MKPCPTTGQPCNSTKCGGARCDHSRVLHEHRTKKQAAQPVNLAQLRRDFDIVMAVENVPEHHRAVAWDSARLAPRSASACYLAIVNSYGTRVDAARACGAA